MPGTDPWGARGQDGAGALTMDSEVEVAAVKLVFGGHLTAVAASGRGLGIGDVQLKQVHLWGEVSGRWGSKDEALTPEGGWGWLVATDLLTLQGEVNPCSCM